jgi:hypothetical protein
MTPTEDLIQHKQSEQADEISRLIIRVEQLEAQVKELTKGQHDNER